MAEEALRIQNEDFKFMNGVRPEKTVVILAPSRITCGINHCPTHILHILLTETMVLTCKFENDDNYVAAVYNNTLYDFVSKNENEAKEAFKKHVPDEPVPEEYC